MPRGMHKSRTQRRVFVKTPGNRTTIHYRLKTPEKAKCGKCGAVLAGVASKRPVQMAKLSKSEKRPERPYGGVLCSKCTRNVMREKAKAFSIGSKE